MGEEDFKKFKLSKIPKGSRLEKYLKKVPEAIDKKEIMQFFQNAFRECLDFICLNEDIPLLPIISIRLVFLQERFNKELEKKMKTSILREEAKKPELTRAFVVGTKFSKMIYINLESFIELLKFSFLSFIMNLIDTYIHEIVHVAFPEKSEQETYELQCVFLEHFLGIKLPEEKKNYKASDYYKSRK